MRVCAARVDGEPRRRAAVSLSRRQAEDALLLVGGEVDPAAVHVPVVVPPHVLDVALADLEVLERRVGREVALDVLDGRERGREAAVPGAQVGKRWRPSLYALRKLSGTGTPNRSV